MLVNLPARCASHQNRIHAFVTSRVSLFVAHEAGSNHDSMDQPSGGPSGARTRHVPLTPPRIKKGYD
jgi:hypothetical protein